MGSCEFVKAWVGYCRKETANGEHYCTDHLAVESDDYSNRCQVCGKQATHECGETFQFVCGALLCDDEKCEIKHHPVNHQFTPKEWMDIYDLDIDEKLFGRNWNYRIEFEEFEKVATLPIKVDLLKEISSQLQKNDSFMPRVYGEKIVATYNGKSFILSIKTVL